MVVDCLLPGQIRQLGGKVTYVTARRAVKTAARDCEIRGGEYVSLDRANYATALKVWLPLAEQGDPAAQTYVGEIYEQGLGIQPDPAAAATWYRKAADKGYSRAALNLGTLYEQGRGVPRDPAQALNWYRRASGLPPAASFELTSTASTTEVQQLRAEVGQLRRELDAKGQELTRLQGELDGARKTLEGRRSEADAERGTVTQLRQELDANRQRENTGRGRITELEKSLTEREARLAQVDRDLAAARSAQAAAEHRKSADVSRLASQAAQLQTQAEADRGQVANLRAQLAESRKDASSQTARVTELERSVSEREASLAAKNKEMDTLRATVAQLEGETKDQRERLDRLRQQTATTGSGPVIQIMQPELRTMRDGKNVRASVATDRTVIVGRVTSETELLTFTINDRAEKLLANNVFRTDVALVQPEQPVRIVAIDKQGRRSALEFVVARTTPPPTAAASAPAGDGPRVGLVRSGTMSFGTYHALVIGNNDYKQLRRLKTAVADAREVARVLEKDYGFRVKLLLNATRYDILAALNDLREKLSEKDNLLIYYAGHGELDERNQRGHWLPVDAEPNSTANWISNLAITDVLNATNVQQLLVVADSCYSGTLTRSSLGRLEGGLSDTDRLKLLSAMAQRRSRMVLTSGGVEPVIDSAGGGHSAFAHAFLAVLRSNVGVMPGQELFINLQLKVAAIAERVQMWQVPEYAPIKYAGHESGDFVFVRQN
jgi:predicted  nucleic acid-binding Zn-ribbon protein